MRKLSLCGLLLLLSLPASAGLIGSDLHWDYYAYGGVYETGNTWTVPASGGSFCLFCGVTYFSILADDTSITFDYSVYSLPPDIWASSVLSLAPTIHNGIAINLVSGPAFTSVSINPLTNMAGFNASRFSFTGSQIQVDWVDLPFDSSTIVKLDVNTSSVPEPGTALYIPLAVATATCITRWRQRKRS